MVVDVEPPLLEAPAVVGVTTLAAVELRKVDVVLPETGLEPVEEIPEFPVVDAPLLETGLLPLVAA